MVQHQEVQAINQTNHVNLQQMQQSAQVYSSPGINDFVGGQQGYVPSEQGAPVDTVVKQQVQSQQQIEAKQQIEGKKQQIEAKQQRDQQAQQAQRTQQAQQAKQLQQLKQQEQQLKRQIQQAQQQAQPHQVEPQKQSKYSTYFIQTCFVIALVAGVILYYLNQKGFLGISRKPAAPIRVSNPTIAVPAEGVTGGNLNNMFKYLFNN